MFFVKSRGGLLILWHSECGSLFRHLVVHGVGRVHLLVVVDHVHFAVMFSWPGLGGLVGTPLDGVVSDAAGDCPAYNWRQSNLAQQLLPRLKS